MQVIEVKTKDFDVDVFINIAQIVCMVWQGDRTKIELTNGQNVVTDLSPDEIMLDILNSIPYIQANKRL